MTDKELTTKEESAEELTVKFTRALHNFIELGDIGHEYLKTVLMDELAPQDLKVQIALAAERNKVAVLPKNVIHSGDESNPILLTATTEATRKLEQILFENPAVVATQQDDDVEDGEMIE